MEKFEKDIERLKLLFEQKSKTVIDKKSFEELRNLFLSRKKGYVKEIFNQIKNLPSSQKPHAGKLANEFKEYIVSQLAQIEKNLSAIKREEEKIDLFLPGERRYIGSIHPINIIQKEIEEIFLTMGYSIEEGPEIETDYYNFSALNFPEEHPARDMWDTLYITDDILLRTHTSPVQVRVMERKKPPIKIIVPGRVFRKDEPDPTHLPMFYQVEGLVVDEDISFSHLKGTLDYFLKVLFSGRVRTRFRPSYFPFTEPSAEVDISCPICEGNKSDCGICKGTGWIEILGSGMVHPQVLKNVNIDPEKYTGFAFGLGIERIAMIKYQIPDMRLFYENDLRFIRQFS
ncbi:phenylalanine--tRNA ligase subunit alpha [SCandidatus Aminicenantes bacterium Aminicenantia_JdfR_composite]|jgi:phenylalanyl-tRNA synthetase alpha chain|nr:phenylalanine--tRNA ligase subunit alpha [SCandidatus Aminicenantes bacterium Aminicenantia_JdfR_composite]MCP2597058.1 phenylalanine--tRNA ligase subunit alpha [Candidatus Aminicenantes bacterium AC-335-G13]MCP2598590.1 phenylalanine--tRNA ligase subunit alpha [Candidatus Aminicenantes bacterium AC-335-L06]MCP2605465.1 phenylalanine--tRNA ligase subunit alpha [Candidatus Aminicenantes bacterium AC-335-O07]MCP2620953.1 phenylalanine--tRNA ligase subunit alpha [Candidatus Aminicenantes bacter